MSDLDELARIRRRVLKDIGNICSIYPTVGAAFWDEPRERLAGRVASWSYDIEKDNERLRLIIADAHRQLSAAWKSGDLPASALNGETIRAMAAVADTVPQSTVKRCRKAR